MLAPPCIRHRPFCIAGDWQGVPRRVLAPHLGALFGSPGGFPFFSHPFRGVAGCSFDFVWVIFSGGRSTTVLAHRANDGLTAFIDIYVSHYHLVSDLSTVAIQSLHLHRESSHQFRGEIDIGIYDERYLAFPRRTLETLHSQIVHADHLDGE